ncbi:hypothetical protein ACVOMV_31960 [Mesorhizobium atlanticum]
MDCFTRLEALIDTGSADAAEERVGCSDTSPPARESPSKRRTNS